MSESVKLATDVNVDMVIYIAMLVGCHAHCIYLFPWWVMLLVVMINIIVVVIMDEILNGCHGD